MVLSLTPAACCRLPQVVRYWWTSFEPQQYGALLRALGGFGYSNEDPLWLMELLAQVHCKVHLFGPAAAANALVGLARFKQHGAYEASKKLVSDVLSQVRPPGLRFMLHYTTEIMGKHRKCRFQHFGLDAVLLTIESP